MTWDIPEYNPAVGRIVANMIFGATTCIDCDYGDFTWREYKDDFTQRVVKYEITGYCRKIKKQVNEEMTCGDFKDYKNG